MKIILTFIFLFINSVFAVDASMEIVKKGTNLPNIVINVSSDIQSVDFTNKIKNVIEQDLMVSGHFNIRNDLNAYSFDSKPDIFGLRKNGVDLYVNLYANTTNSGVVLNVKLFDINSDTEVFTNTFNSNSKERFPFLGHRASIAINKYLNAPTIDWMERFVIFSRYSSPKTSEIVIADYTLAYQKVIITGGLNIFPKWADQEQTSFYYTSYKTGTPTLNKINIYSGQREKIISSDGMVVCSDVSEDGSKLLLTMSPSGQPDIYLFDTNTRIKTRITDYQGIDVGGYFVENDTKVVFVSDRLKYPNIFAKKIGSRGVERLVYHGKNNSSATTYKNYVVYTSREGDNEFSKGSFNLYLISTTSDFLRRLTTTGRNQFPKFSHDGESILFLKDYNGRSSIGIIRLNYDKSFLFPLNSGKIQSIDW